MNGTDRFPIHKMNGLGNQIVVADLRATHQEFTCDQVRQIANHPRTPFDQIMCLHPAKTNGTAAFVRIFNQDGSAAGACGNGMRCVALLVREQVDGRDLTFETPAGVLRVTYPSDELISVDMGRPKFGWQDIPLRDPFHDTTRIELQVGPIDDPVLHSPSVCSMGNPQAVFWVDDVGRHDLDKFGPLLENHPIFPDRANISVAQVVRNDLARTRTWERGAGLTQACGSAACAVLVNGVRTKQLDRRAVIEVPGGRLDIAWRDDDHVIMTGPAELEYSGLLHLAGDGAVTLEI